MVEVETGLLELSGQAAVENERVPVGEERREGIRSQVRPPPIIVRLRVKKPSPF
jgi:hypothetical protein